MIWDGDCSFCKYWVIRWQQMTGDKIEYKPYQQVLQQIPDIPEWACREAARLIDEKGYIYNGPDAAYKALEHTKRWRHLHKAYVRSDLFRYASDHGYVWIAGHRNFLFSLTKLLFGKDPEKPKKFWLYYLLTLGGAILVVLALLLHF